jgi:hypothetical protein
MLGQCQPILAMASLAQFLDEFGILVGQDRTDDATS